MLYDDCYMDFHQVLTPEEMRRVEQKAFSLGVPSLLLMEHAAISVVDELQKALGGSCRNKRALFLCGTGNNGGDGLAAARLFAMREGIATVYLSGQPKTPDAKANLAWAREMGLDMLDLSALTEEELPFMEGGFRLGFDGFVDALLGTGLRGAPEGLTKQLIDAANNDAMDGSLPMIAVDIPSGIDGKTGAAPGAFIRANITVTFHAPKRGLYLTRRRDAVGKIVVADIGLWAMDYACGTLDPDWEECPCTVNTEKALLHLPARKIDAHKGSENRVLIYAGQLGMAGAAAMCMKAAVAAGAGLTTAACEKELIPILQTLEPNAMCVDIGDAVQNPPSYDVLALGCGLGQSEEKWQNILRLWDPEKPSVWDADALNMLSRHPMKLGMLAVITPHPGEAARLLGWSVEQILADKLKTARTLSEKYDCTAVLKGDVTVICSQGKDGPVCRLNAIGSPALAKGGSGDALTGILAACLKKEPRLSGLPDSLISCNTGHNAALACLWHGMAGIVGEEKFGQRELTTSQLISCLHEAEQWGKGVLPAPKCYRDT